jgi:hypothetical protein
VGFTWDSGLRLLLPTCDELAEQRCATLSLQQAGKGQVVIRPCVFDLVARNCPVAISNDNVVNPDEPRLLQSDRLNSSAWVEHLDGEQFGEGVFVPIRIVESER